MNGAGIRVRHEVEHWLPSRICHRPLQHLKLGDFSARAPLRRHFDERSRRLHVDVRKGNIPDLSGECGLRSCQNLEVEGDHISGERLSNLSLQLKVRICRLGRCLVHSCHPLRDVVMQERFHPLVNPSPGAALAFGLSGAAEPRCPSSVPRLLPATPERRRRALSSGPSCARHGRRESRHRWRDAIDFRRQLGTCSPLGPARVQAHRSSVTIQGDCVKRWTLSASPSRNESRQYRGGLRMNDNDLSSAGGSHAASGAGCHRLSQTCITFSPPGNPLYQFLSDNGRRVRGVDGIRLLRPRLRPQPRRASGRRPAR